MKQFWLSNPLRFFLLTVFWLEKCSAESSIRSSYKFVKELNFVEKLQIWQLWKRSTNSMLQQWRQELHVRAYLKLNNWFTKRPEQGLIYFQLMERFWNFLAVISILRSIPFECVVINPSVGHRNKSTQEHLWISTDLWISEQL